MASDYRPAISTLPPAILHAAAGHRNMPHADDLPLDVLREIFLAYNDCFHIMDEHRARRAPPRTLISVSHVSRRWRAIAIACQQLWSAALPCGSLEWTELCLSRCFSGPFELAVSALDLHESEEYRAAYALVLPHLTRVCSIAYEYDTEVHDEQPRGDKGRLSSADALRDLLARMATTAMPNARELAIYYSFEYLPLEDIMELDFAKNMPALDDIFLRGIVFKPIAGRPIFPAGICSLDLDDSNCWWTVDEMIDVLRTMPMLKYLEHTTYPMTFPHGLASEPSHKHPLRCVELRNLEHLVCSCGSFARNMLFFGYICFPPTAELQIIHPHSLRTTLDAGSRSPAQVDAILPLGEMTIREHFAAAIRQGAFYPDVFLDSSSVSVLPDRGVWPREPVLPFGTSACHLLPSKIKLDVPDVGDELRTHRDNPRNPRPYHDLLFGTWTSMPFFANASVLHLLPDFDDFSIHFFEGFRLVREVHFASLDMFNGLFSDMIENDHPNHARGLFPMLTTIHVGCSGDMTRLDESLNADLQSFEALADTILFVWGSSLRRLILHQTELLVSRTETLALLERCFGADRIVCAHNQDSTPYCCCYMARPRLHSCQCGALHEEDDSESGGDEEGGESDNGSIAE